MGQLAVGTRRTGFGEARVGLELACEALVEMTPVRRRQLPLNDLAEELVAEPVPAVGQQDDDALGRRLTEVTAHDEVVLFDGGCEEPLLGRPTGNRERLEDRLAVR
jgi:hypothetical protein